MLRFLIVAGLVCGLFSDQAEAKTIRYEFDVVDSTIDYQWLEKILPDPNADHTIGVAEYAAFTAAYHPLGGAMGLTGPVVLEVEHQNHSYWEADLFCVSGFLCESDAFHYSQVANYSALSGFEAFPSAHEWSLDGGLYFFEDGAISGNGYLEDVLYLWWAPRATFTLANLNISEVSAVVTPVPLPAAASLLAMGLMILGVGARQRSRAA